MDSCSARFPPNSEHILQATTLKHYHFKSLTNYEDASKVQNSIVNRHLEYKIKNKNSRAIVPSICPTILTFEINSVYTGGKREKDSQKATKIPMQESGSNMTSIGVPYVQTDRGGQVTYHGPGQLVAYFVWDLKLWKNLTSKCFVNFIEKCSLKTIENAGVNNVCTTENTGVWIKKNDVIFEKISSIGLNLKRNVTSHGLSINLKPNLKYLNNPEFIMCGLNGFHQTSIENEIGETNLNVAKLGDLLCNVVEDRMNSYMINAVGDNKYKLHIEKTEFEDISDFFKY